MTNGTPFSGIPDKEHNLARYTEISLTRNKCSILRLSSQNFRNIQLNGSFFPWKPSHVISVPFQICLGLNANEIQIPNDKHHKVSSPHGQKVAKTHTILSNMKYYCTDISTHFNWNLTNKIN